MARSVSVSDAKDQLTRLLREVEAGEVVHLTRRGRPVAVVISEEAYRRMLPGRGRVWTDFEAFRARHGLDELGLEPEAWVGTARELAEPRDVDLS